MSSRSGNDMTLVHFIQVVIPRGLIKWYTRKKEQSRDKIFNLEVSEDSAHGEGVIQVLDAKESGLDICKVRVANPRCYVVHFFRHQTQTRQLYRAPKKCLYVVARNFFLLLLYCSAWPCLGPA